MEKDLVKWTNQARFIQMVCDGKLVVSKKKKLALCQELKNLKFKAIPKDERMKEKELEPVLDNDDEQEAENDAETGAADYDYLLGVSDCLKLTVVSLLTLMLDGHLVVDERASRQIAEDDR